MPIEFEQTGWSRIDISPTALNSVQEQLERNGFQVENFDLTPHAAGHRAYLELPEYAGEYRSYGGEDVHCLLEKSLEHYLSFALAHPVAGQTAIDVGSCQSVVPRIMQRVYEVRCYEQDLSYPAGVHDNTIGGSADNIPLPDASVDFMMLHCTFEHFEGVADTGFMAESARLLKPGGRVVSLPLYLNANYCNVSGRDAGERVDITFDDDADHYCHVPEWDNRFGRHYSVEALQRRVIDPAKAAGLNVRILRCHHWEAIDPRLWLRWILMLEKP